MNERIRELAVKSGMLNYIDCETPRHYFLSANADENDLEEFAKLIVRECARVAFNDWCDSTNEASSEKTILEYFGVEVVENETFRK